MSRTANALGAKDVNEWGQGNVVTLRGCKSQPMEEGRGSRAPTRKFCLDEKIVERWAV
jgi:hypothetical protein